MPAPPLGVPPATPATMHIRHASPQDLDALTEVWVQSTEQDPTTPFRYLPCRKNVCAGIFRKLARSKCAGYLNECRFVTVCEVKKNVVAMACWSAATPACSADKSSGQVVAEHLTPEERAKITHKSHAKAWSAESSAAKKTFFDARYPSGYLYLKVLYVLPDFQRQGIGRKLTLWGLDVAQREGLPVALFSSDAGQGLYSKLGFRVVDTLRIKTEGDEQPLEVPGMVLDMHLYASAAAAMLVMLQSREWRTKIMELIRAVDDAADRTVLVQA